MPSTIHKIRYVLLGMNRLTDALRGQLVWARKAGGEGADVADSVALSYVHWPESNPFRDIYITGTIQVDEPAASLTRLNCGVRAMLGLTRHTQKTLCILLALCMACRNRSTSPSNPCDLEPSRFNPTRCRYNASDGQVRQLELYLLFNSAQMIRFGGPNWLQHATRPMCIPILGLQLGTIHTGVALVRDFSCLNDASVCLTDLLIANPFDYAHDEPINQNTTPICVIGTSHCSSRVIKMDANGDIVMTGKFFGIFRKAIYILFHRAICSIPQGYLFRFRCLFTSFTTVFSFTVCMVGL